MNRSEQKEVFFRVGREEGVKEEALNSIWELTDKLAGMGLIGDLKSEEASRNSFKQWKDRLNSFSYDVAPRVEIVGAVVLAKQLEDVLGKGGDEDEGASVQGIRRVQGSC
jgi:hypothetical protein